MGMPDVTLRIKANSPVRIEGRSFVAGPIGPDGRIFTEKATGHQISLSNTAQLRMARTFKLTSEGNFQALDDNVREALETDWGTFSVPERTTAEGKQRYCAGVDELPLRDRHKKAAIQKVIDQVGDANGVSVGMRPSPRMVRTWDRLWLAGGRDIRALVPFNWKKGNRTPKLPRWMVEEIDKAIDEVYAVQPPGSEADARRRAVTRIRDRAAHDGLTIPDLGQRDVIGRNVIARALKHREQHDLISKRYGKEEADRALAALGTGPQGDWPLSEVEVDHTLLDIIVIDPKTNAILGRPWLTALIDRYSRCIVGFYIGFHPPSWTSVMQAVQHAVMPKGEWLTGLGGIHEAYRCHGVPDKLFVDGGREFLSTSMKAMESALNMKLVPLPKRRGDLKGKIERWLGSIQQQVVHKLPGTTLSNVVLRKDYDAEGNAIMSLAQLRRVVAKWIVDVYHQENHPATGEAPSDRWVRGHALCGEKPPPKELLAPLTGIADRRVLTREGIRYSGLKWNSNEFSKLRNRIGLDAEVDIRIDPLDLEHAYVYDAKRRKWIEGDLTTDDVEVGETLHQYEVIKRRGRDTREPGESKLAAISRARGEIFDFVKGISDGNVKSKAPKRFARFAGDGRKPSEHLAPERSSPGESRGRRPGHRHDPGRPRRGTHSAAGPFRRAGFSPEPSEFEVGDAPAADDPLPTPATAGRDEIDGATQPLRHDPDQDLPVPPMPSPTLRRRRI